MTTKQEVSMLRNEVRDLKELTLQTQKLTEELSIIILGSEKLGAQGMRARQHHEEQFREQMMQDMVSLNSKLEDQAQLILQQVDKRMSTMQVELRDVVEWRANWNRAIQLISSSTTWRVLFMIGLGIAGVIIFVKFKILGWLPTDFFKLK